MIKEEERRRLPLNEIKITNKVVKENKISFFFIKFLFLSGSANETPCKLTLN